LREINSLIIRFMGTKARQTLLYSTLIIVLLFFLFWGLTKAKAFLAPVSVAALLAMVVLPVSRWLEGKGVKRGFSALLSGLLILVFFGLMAWVLTAQVKSFANDWPKIKERVVPQIEQLQQFITDKTGITQQEQKKKISEKIPGNILGSNQKQNQNSQENDTTGAQNQPATATDSTEQETAQNREQQPSEQAEKQEQRGGGSSGAGSIVSSAGTFAMQLISFFGTFLLTFVYIFFFLVYRGKFKKSILKMAPDDKREKTEKILTDSTRISQSYLTGRLILILFLAILYSAGLSISGVKHAILISVLAATLSLIPYIGNIVGFFLAIGMAFFSGSGVTGAIGVAITFAIAQFVESYILEPYIVGDKVDLNPVVTILVVVLGEAVWGITGMLIAIPALGILKVVFDHIPVLRPLGYLFGNEDIGDDDKEENKSNIFSRTKRWASNKFK
jgi:predicted PurR-regulated permease PerM